MSEFRVREQYAFVEDRKEIVLLARQRWHPKRLCEITNDPVPSLNLPDFEAVLTDRIANHKGKHKERKNLKELLARVREYNESVDSDFERIKYTHSIPRETDGNKDTDIHA